MDFTCIILGIVFVVTGILFAMGKLHILLTPWKMMSDEEKDKIAIVPLCLNIGEIIGLSGLIFLFNGLFSEFKNHWFVLSMVAWMIVAGLDLMYIEKSPKFTNIPTNQKKEVNKK